MQESESRPTEGHPRQGQEDQTQTLIQRPAPQPLPVEIAVASDRGKVREVNEDSVLVEDPAYSAEAGVRGALLLVADGMGGHAAGDVASQLAVKAARTAYFASGRHRVVDALRDGFMAANDEILAHAAERPDIATMGSTLTAAVVLGDRLIVAHVGDSRAYLVRGQSVVQLTRDHSWVAEQVLAGAMTEDEARNHPQRNVITRALGHGAEVEVDQREESLQAGDLVLLCTDGLSQLATNAEIGEHVRGAAPSRAVQDLVSLANRRGAPDNVTVAVLRYGQPPRSWVNRYWPLLVAGAGTIMVVAVAAAVIVTQSPAPPGALPTAPPSPAPGITPPRPPILASPSPSPSPARAAARIEGPEGSANLRATPSVTASVRAELPNGTSIITIREIEGDEVVGSRRWIEVEVLSGAASGQRGFVHGSLIKTS